MSVDPVSFLKEILGMYSPSKMEGELTSFLLDKMRDFGISTKVDRVGNVVGEIGDGDPMLLLCGHMDTVNGFLDVVEKDGKIFGRGAVDAKSSLAAMILAAARLAEEELAHKVMIAGVVDEEGDSIGMRNLLKNGLSVRYAIFGEPSKNNHVVVGYRGSVTFGIECEAPPGHVAAPSTYVSAIEKSLDLWTKIKKGLSIRGKSLFYSVTPSLMLIRGRAGGAMTGERWCEMAVNARFPLGMRAASIDEIIEDLISQFQLDNPEVKVRKRLLHSFEPIKCRRSSEVARALVRAITDVTGSTPKTTIKTGSSDMNLLSGSEIQAVSFGPGDPILEHTDDEWIYVNEYLQAIRIYKTTIEKLFDLVGSEG
ncbi:MAG: M20/M25/M40 family metallo-hydrolase [Candidatus Bathyarchaeia archaeon]